MIAVSHLVGERDLPERVSSGSTLIRSIFDPLIHQILLRSRELQEKAFGSLHPVPLHLGLFVIDRDDGDNVERHTRTATRQLILTRRDPFAFPLDGMAFRAPSFLPIGKIVCVTRKSVRGLSNAIRLTSHTIRFSGDVVGLVTLTVRLPSKPVGFARFGQAENAGHESGNTRDAPDPACAVSQFHNYPFTPSPGFRSSAGGRSFPEPL